MKNRLPRWLIIAFVLFLLLVSIPGGLVEWLWLGALGYEAVFWQILWAKVLLFFATLAVVTAFFGVNFYVLLRRLPPIDLSRWAQGPGGAEIGEIRVTRGHVKRIAIVVTAVLGLLFASGFAAGWENALLYMFSGDYGEVDPIFGRDIAFYMLELPFIEAVQGVLLGMTFLGLLMLVAIYVLIGDFVIQNGRVRARDKVVRHVSVNAALLLIFWSWGLYLDRFGLLISPGEVVFGGSYTDINVVLPALWVMIVITLALAAIVVANIRWRRMGLLLAGGGVYIVVSFVGLTIIPALVQQVYVEPNELDLERPYIAYNIDLTREAYGLRNVRIEQYPAEADLTADELRANEATLRNIRLWDPRLIADTYRQLQEIRTYYEFYNVDIDRYMINGEYREVMIAARQLTSQLPGNADTWFNRHLQYTHGYGMTMSPVAVKGDQGLPTLYIRDIPPVVTVEGIEVTQPAIYYGEGTPDYRIVDTEARELHYPQGDQNVYNHYDGEGGVNIGSFWRQLLFGWHLSDFNLIVSGYITEDTRVQFWNQIEDRVRHIAPFLRLDADPYVVLVEDGTKWIIDAYTVASAFPYSEPSGERFDRFNYIRNSVKIVIDAYHGTVDFYVVDPEDPVLEAYQRAFPDLFKPFSAIPEAIVPHLRYPRDIFEAQVQKYQRYHMTVPQVFYNNEDLWVQPIEQYAGRRIRMNPYYILMQLPEEDTEEFLLMTPYTPARRDNMIAWFAARSDYPNHGELIVYELPKDELIFGPNQIESRIDQDTEVSEQLTLWNQQGSNVVRGNLMVVPVAGSFLYVKPVFLIAEGAQIPQLRRVILVYGNNVVMRRTLQGALAAIFGEIFDVRPEVAEEAIVELGAEGVPGEPAPTPGVSPDVAPELQTNLEAAREAIQEADAALRRGDFAAFGQAFEQVQELLDEAIAADSL